MPKSIVAAIAADDGLPAATRTARVAATLARDLGRRLVLAHVVKDPPAFPYGDPWRREVQRHQLVEHGTDLLRALATAAGEPAADTRVALAGFLRGGPAECLDAICRRELADMMVVSSATSAAVPVQSSRLSPCPLLVVPDGAANDEDDRHRSLVVGVDGSVASNRARLVAERFADRLGLRLIVLATDQGTPWEDVALRHAARLIAVGTRGCGAGLGPVASSAVASAPVPVLVVPRTARLPSFGTGAARVRVRRTPRPALTHVSRGPSP